MSLTRPPAEFSALIAELRNFMDTVVIPSEDLKTAHDGDAINKQASELRVEALKRGLRAPRRAVSDGASGSRGKSAASFLKKPVGVSWDRRHCNARHPASLI